MSTLTPLVRIAAVACALLLAACSPKYDWREVRGGGAPFIVTLPGKPASHTREINLDGLPIAMTMTAAEVDNVTFAVGAAKLADAAQSPKALNAMKTALVRNIGGTLRHEQADAAPATIAIEASGPPASGRGEPRLLLARFHAKDNFIYQVIVVGPEKNVSREAADTFFTSFKPD
ncbi:MAG TPA: hypothetical protein VGE12_15805 [Noviherbaspirillum sp.]